MALEDLGFDFSDEHDDFDVVNTVFSADDSTVKRESSPPGDNSTIPNRQQNETQVNGITVDDDISWDEKKTLTCCIYTSGTHTDVNDDQGEDEKAGRIQDASDEHREKDPYNDLDPPAGSYADDYNDTDEYLEPTPPEGFGSDSLIQVMSEGQWT